MTAAYRRTLYSHYNWHLVFEASQCMTDIPDIRHRWLNNKLSDLAQHKINFLYSQCLVQKLSWMHKAVMQSIHKNSNFITWTCWRWQICIQPTLIRWSLPIFSRTTMQQSAVWGFTLVI